MPKAGPDHPMDIVILTDASGLFSLIKSLIISNAFSETVNIKYPPFKMNIPYSSSVKIVMPADMSITSTENNCCQELST